MYHNQIAWATTTCDLVFCFCLKYTDERSRAQLHIWSSSRLSPTSPCHDSFRNSPHRSRKSTGKHREHWNALRKGQARFTSHSSGHESGCHTINCCRMQKHPDTTSESQGQKGGEQQARRGNEVHPADENRPCVERKKHPGTSVPHGTCGEINCPNAYLSQCGRTRPGKEETRQGKPNQTKHGDAGGGEKNSLTSHCTTQGTQQMAAAHGTWHRRSHWLESDEISYSQGSW